MESTYRRNNTQREIILSATERSMTGNPYLKNGQKVMRSPAFRARSTITTVALAPVIVPFPPKHAPETNTHQSGIMSG